MSIHEYPDDKFMDAADAYCRARREYLDIRKRMASGLGEGLCNVEGHEGYEWVPPCFRWDSAHFDCIEEWCDQCKPWYADAHRKDELRTQFSALMRAMLKAWKEYVES